MELEHRIFDYMNEIGYTNKKGTTKKSNMTEMNIFLKLVLFKFNKDELIEIFAIFTQFYNCDTFVLIEYIGDEKLKNNILNEIKHF